METVDLQKDKGTFSKFSVRMVLMLLALCLTHFLVGGRLRSNSLLFVALMEEEQYGRFVASFSGSARGAATIVMAGFTAYLGSRLSFLTLASFGLFLFSMGQAMCFFSTNIYVVTVFQGFIAGGGMMLLVTHLPFIINTTFKGNRTTAMGLSTVGQPLGGFFWPYLTHYFLEKYGLKGTYLLTAGVSLHAFICIVYISECIKKMGNTDYYKNTIKRRNFKMKTTAGNKAESPIVKIQESELQLPVQDELDLKESDQLKVEEEVVTISRRKLLRRIVTSRGFYMLSFTNSLNFFCQAGINQILVDYMTDEGLEKKSALLMITAFSAGGIIGRLCFGWVTDKGFLSSRVQKAVSMMVSGTMYFAISFLLDFYSLGVCYFILGICQASSMIVNWVQFSLYFEEEEMMMAMSANRFVNGFVQLSRTPIIGYFRDLLHTYDYYYLFTSGILYLLGCLWLCEEYHFKRKEKAYRKLNTEDPDEA